MITRYIAAIVLKQNCKYTTNLRISLSSVSHVLSIIWSLVSTFCSLNFPQHPHIMPLTLSNIMPRKNNPLKEILFHNGNGKKLNLML